MFFKSHWAISFTGAKNTTNTVTSPAMPLTTTGSHPPAHTISSSLPLANVPKLTRSERLFSVTTHVDTRSMSIRDDDEFYLFMDMRAENKWVSFSMTPRKWVAATRSYNARLEALNLANRRITVAKNPRALADMLGEIEGRITNRILTNNFVCKLSWLYIPPSRWLRSTDSFQKQHRHILEETLPCGAPGKGSRKCRSYGQ